MAQGIGEGKTEAKTTPISAEERVEAKRRLMESARSFTIEERREFISLLSDGISPAELPFPPLVTTSRSSTPRLPSTSSSSSSSSFSYSWVSRTDTASLAIGILTELDPVDDSGYPREEQLRRAARRGDVRRVDALLKAGVKPGDSLFAAAEAKNNRAFERLLVALPDLGQKPYGYSIAEYVALYSPWSTVEKRTALETLAKQGQSLPRIHWAACLGEGEEVVREIARHQLVVRDGMSNTAAFYASANGHLSLLRGLYEKGVRATEANKTGTTALLWAAWRGHLPVVQWLLREGEARMTEADENGATALLLAAREGHLPMAQWLLREGGARVTGVRENGVTALLEAASGGHLSMVQWLLREGGARVTEASKDGMTALLWAAYEGHLPVVQWLLREGGAQVTETNEYGATALLEAVYGGHLPVIQWLVKEGRARVTEADKHDNTALVLAAEHGHLLVLQWLLFDYGAPRDKRFLDYIKDSKYGWLRCYLAFVDSLKCPISSQVEALKAALHYSGEKSTFLKERVVDLLLKQDCETLLTHPDWSVHPTFRALWNNEWRQYTHEEVDGLTLVLSEVHWSVSKLNFYQQYLSTQPIKVLRMPRSHWFTTESWLFFLQQVAALPLVVLDLTDNRLGDEPLLQLAIVLIKNRTLTRCILDRNHLSYRGFQDLLRILALHPILTTLSVRENFIDEMDKVELDRTIGSVLRDEKCHLQTVDVSGNYLMSRATHPTRLAAFRQLLRSTGLTVEEFAQAEWIREKDSTKSRHLTILSLQINGSVRDFEVPIEGMFAPKQIVIDYFPFDIQRGESFREKYYLVAFTVSKKRIKAMELLIEGEIGKLPGKYKMVLSSGSVSSSDEDQKVMTNCQKWALEKLEWCLEMKEGSLQAQMSARPSATAANLQKLPVAERIVGMDEKVESGVVPVEGGSKCCVM